METVTVTIQPVVAAAIVFGIVILALMVAMMASGPGGPDIGT